MYLCANQLHFMHEWKYRHSIEKLLCSIFHLSTKSILTRKKRFYYGLNYFVASYQMTNKILYIGI